MVAPVQRVAVCVPAYDETERLAALLESIRTVEYPSDYLQVVVAVDGGDPRVVSVAENCGAKVAIVSPNRGSYAARNAAVDAVEAPVEAVFFTDADCEVSPQWVSAHLSALSVADLSGGGIRWKYSDPPTPAEWVDSLRHLHQQLYVERDGYAATANLAVRWGVLNELRFDDTLRTGGDAEFGRRAVAAGYALAYTDDAWVWHLARSNRAELMRKVRRIAGGVHGQRDRWVERGAPPRARFNRGPYRRALDAELKVGPVWGLRASLLNFEATVRINRAVRKTLGRAAGPESG